MLRLIKKYKEQILYLVFGVLTTLVNLVSYFLCRSIAFTVAGATIIAWFIAVLFAFVTNKLFVFESRVKTFRQLLFQIAEFFGCRLFTGLLDLGIMYLTVELLSFYEPAMKIISNVVVVVLNYVFSKLIIFKKHNKK